MSTSPITPALHRLLPFPNSSATAEQDYELWVNAEVKTSESDPAAKPVLHVRYKLEAKTSAAFAKILWPATAEAQPIRPAAEPSATRRHELWKETCFECFIPIEASKEYLEFNFSPTGDWNAYAFYYYRSEPVEFDISPKRLPRGRVLLKTDRLIEFEAEITLTAINEGFFSVAKPGGVIDDLGITVVLKTTNETTYWALKHDAEKPDFHVRSSFTYAI